MSLKQIRVNEFTVNDLRKRGEKYGNPTDDAMIRIVLAENDLLKSEKSENECLKKRIADLEKENERLKLDILFFEKMVNDRDEVIKQLTDKDKE